MREEMITSRKELFRRLAFVELYLDIENNGKTVAFECPTTWQDDKNHPLGYSYWGEYTKYKYNLDEYEDIVGIFYDAFQFWKESYTKNLELKIDAFKRSIL